MDLFKVREKVKKQEVDAALLAKGIPSAPRNQYLKAMREFGTLQGFLWTLKTGDPVKDQTETATSQSAMSILDDIAGQWSRQAKI